MKIVTLLLVLMMTGCIASPDYREQKSALNDYHEAKIKLKVAEDLAVSANKALGKAQLEYDAAKDKMDKVEW